MISSFTVSVVFFIMKKTGHALPFAQTIVCSVALTTICWMIAAFTTTATDRARLVAFYLKVRPAGPGWTVIRDAAGVSATEAARHGDNMGQATLGWISGCITIWSSLFAIGYFLYGRTSTALALSAVFVVSGLTLLRVVNHLWDVRGAPEAGG